MGWVGFGMLGVSMSATGCKGYRFEWGYVFMVESHRFLILSTLWGGVGCQLGASGPLDT